MSLATPAIDIHSMTHGHAGARLAPVVLSLLHRVAEWWRLQKATAEIASLDFRARQDLGFPAVFDGDVVAPGRRSTSANPYGSWR